MSRWKCRLSAWCAVALLAASVAHAQDSTRTPATAPVPWVVQAEQLLENNRPQEARAAAEKAVVEFPQNPHGWFVLARACQAAGDLDAAIKAGHQAANFAAVRASAFYNLACAYAVKGDKADAFRALASAKLAGFADRDQMAKDPDLASLRDDPRFVLPLERNFFTLKLADGTDLPFSVDLPVGYNPANAYPVLIAPGLGKKVDGNWGGLFWGEDTSQRGWITVETPAFLLEHPIEALEQLLDEVSRRYRAEGGKFHLACYGPSSGPCFALAMTVPARVRSLTAVPGFPVTDDEAELNKLTGIKVSFIVGENDAIWLNESERAYNRLKSLGVETYLEIVPGANHLLQEMFGGELAERLQLVR
ncbi:MAG TPA: tetratricopeptide repeat protein [Candidatus Krumholzibacteria bacterium]|nr:tetratricopeptide repeat protein [Candidatus Krumholzibacteria bacterium]